MVSMRPISDHTRFIAIRRSLVRSDLRMSELPRLWIRSLGTALRNQKTSPRLATKDVDKLSKAQTLQLCDGVL
jgi:hypothetical protein